VVPSLAESWAISKDGKEYTLHLRKGVIFHNGKELDAEDVKWSLEYALDPKNRAYVHGSVLEAAVLAPVGDWAFG
jgi:ABC-type transport system substrate-binding protein